MWGGEDEKCGVERESECGVGRVRSVGCGVRSERWGERGVWNGVWCGESEECGVGRVRKREEVGWGE